MEYDFILASGSPRRRELLTKAGQSFIIKTADVNESYDESLTPEEIVKILALKKAQAVYEKYGKITLGADTVVAFRNTVIGKPATKSQAKEMLKALSGNVHEVYTGVALIGDNFTVNTYEKTLVYMNELSDEFIDEYILSGRAMDKAGAYGMQDGGFVEKIEGSYTNVVGLPMELIEKILGEKGLWQVKK